MKSTRNKGFSLELCSDLDFEGMVVDVNYDDHPIATGNYDKGVNNIEITLLPIYTDSKTLSVPLDEFLKVLEKAKKILQRCAKEDETRDKL